jgi:hypothetical protein
MSPVIDRISVQDEHLGASRWWFALALASFLAHLYLSQGVRSLALEIAAALDGFVG